MNFYFFAPIDELVWSRGIAAHDHRAATEQVPRVANNVDATRHGGRSEWPPIIDCGQSTMISAVFSCVLRVANGLSYGCHLL